MKHILIVIVLFLLSCKQSDSDKEPISVIHETVVIKKELIVERKKSIPTATHFDYPVGKPNGKGYYNAQKFGENDHLGDDWNAVTGGDSDLGDPIYAIANGQVTFAKDIGSGWGKVIRISHKLPDSTYIESLYAHCDQILVSTDSIIKRGDQIGTIGTANGAYLAHLHFEIRDSLEMHIGGGYSETTEGYLNPTKFIKDHR
ncbi:peptidase M23-like protein [Nonlabens xylanidelens]|uniref:Peptidase M23-like protein n=1 Tax=Nonlabens xylanidelens TaxID=191564 RepID=A0A2S6IFQ2_9FLAO|nr:M23 family metallopeptidase [Nonlabens xylanidelens]PPK93044.1 peptidase M23-like protein [Nonlabens xylanidelens]